MTEPRWEKPFSLHDGYGGREWYYRAAGVVHGEFETYAEALKGYNDAVSACLARQRVMESISTLPAERVEILALKGMV